MNERSNQTTDEPLLITLCWLVAALAFTAVLVTLLPATF
jgi:hypothetical protein